MKVQITVFGWRTWRPRFRRLKAYRQVHLSWLWFFVCVEVLK